jgi:hypothetical protein
MNNKKLAERLNHELDALGVPGLMTERVQVCSKLFNMPKFKAEALLCGVFSDVNHIQKIADELEVNVGWLLGEVKSKVNH